MDLIHIGETVDVRHPDRVPTWRGEVLDFHEETGEIATARVLCIDPDAHGSMSLGLVATVPVGHLTRVGDPGGMREDGCDDVDVTGRTRPYHRHAVTGKAHAHPSGGLAHTHQTVAEWQAMSQAATAAMGRKIAVSELVQQEPAPDRPTPDPVEIVARHFTWTGDLGSNERSIRAALAELVAGPWHLVTGQRQTGTVMHLAGGGRTPGERLIEIHQEWKP